ncbi:hypothetical protein L0F63_004722 [Massospora cicadina]|nr:hypothetical protein L0F63_004722 [Massospora cicadina]
MFEVVISSVRIMVRRSCETPARSTKIRLGSVQDAIQNALAEVTSQLDLGRSSTLSGPETFGSVNLDSASEFNCAFSDHPGSGWVHTSDGNPNPLPDLATFSSDLQLCFSPVASNPPINFAHDASEQPTGFAASHPARIPSDAIGLNVASTEPIDFGAFFSEGHFNFDSLPLGPHTDYAHAPFIQPDFAPVFTPDHAHLEAVDSQQRADPIPNPSGQPSFGRAHPDSHMSFGLASGEQADFAPAPPKAFSPSDWEGPQLVAPPGTPLRPSFDACSFTQQLVNISFEAFRPRLVWDHDMVQKLWRDVETSKHNGVQNSFQGGEALKTGEPLQRTKEHEPACFAKALVTRPPKRAKKSTRGGVGDNLKVETTAAYHLLIKKGSSFCPTNLNGALAALEALGPPDPEPWIFTVGEHSIHVREVLNYLIATLRNMKATSPQSIPPLSDQAKRLIRYLVHGLHAKIPHGEPRLRHLARRIAASFLPALQKRKGKEVASTKPIACSSDAPYAQIIHRPEFNPLRLTAIHTSMLSKALNPKVDNE